MMSVNRCSVEYICGFWSFTHEAIYRIRLSGTWQRFEKCCGNGMFRVASRRSQSPLLRRMHAGGPSGGCAE